MKRIMMIIIFLLFFLSFITSVCPAGDEWIKKADMAAPRYAMSASAVNGKIYLIGGGFLNNNSMHTISGAVEEYDPKTETWKKRADMPAPRRYIQASVVNGKIYVMGGLSNDGWGGGLADNEEYDPKTDKWTKKADMPTPRWLFSTSVVDGKIYAMGGFNRNYVANVEEYDPKADTWTPKKDMLARRTSFTSCSANGKIYVFGGAVNGGIDAKDIEEYDPKTNRWHKVSELSSIRADSCASLINGKIYIVGGGVSHWENNISRSKGIRIVEEYDPIRNKWVRKADMPTGRYYFAQVVVDDRIYAFGGVLSSLLDLTPAVEEYIPEGWPFSVSPEGNLVITWGRLRQRSGLP